MRVLPSLIYMLLQTHSSVTAIIERSAPQLIRRWRRRTWIEHCFRTLKHVLAAGACQVHSEAAYYGHLVLRLMGCLVLFYTSRVMCKGRLTMEEIIFSLKPLSCKHFHRGWARKPREHKPNA